MRVPSSGATWQGCAMTLSKGRRSTGLRGGNVCEGTMAQVITVIVGPADSDRHNDPHRRMS